MSEFYAESAARSLRRELGLAPISSSRLRTGDWIKFGCGAPAECGARVYCHDDPRHIGRVEAIHSASFARVRWLDNNWSEEVSLDLLARAEGL